MHIYIDEAGGFIVPIDKENSVSCVGALIIPESSIEDVFNSFHRIKKELGFGEGEIKGSSLNEFQVAKVIDFLRYHNIIFEVTAIDMALHTEDDISNHKSIQASLITENIPIEKEFKYIDKLKHRQQQYRVLSNQLYVQSVCMLQLFSNVLQYSTLYYVQRFPSELENFNWYIDAKGKELTSYEDLLRNMIGPALQDISREKEFTQLLGADYSYFQKYIKISPTPPEHLRKAFGDVSPFEYVDITDIFRKSLSFVQSNENMGIQLVDILTTTVRRAMNHNLQVDGWGNIGSLMVQSKKPGNTIQLVHLFNNEKTRVPYYHVIDITNNTCKKMFE